MSTTPTSQRKTRKLRLEVYLDTDGQIRWRTVSTANGRLLHNPGQGFSSLGACLHNAALGLGFYVDDIHWVSDLYGQVVTTRTDLPVLDIYSEARA